MYDSMALLPICLRRVTSHEVTFIAFIHDTILGTPDIMAIVWEIGVTTRESKIGMITHQPAWLFDKSNANAVPAYTRQ